MADKIPLKAVYTGSEPTSLAEFQNGETIPLANGGTGSTNATSARTNLGLGNIINELQLTASQLVTSIGTEDAKVPSAGAVARYAAKLGDFKFMQFNFLMNCL